MRERFVITERNKQSTHLISTSLLKPHMFNDLFSCLFHHFILVFDLVIFVFKPESIYLHINHCAHSCLLHACILRDITYTLHYTPGVLSFEDFVRYVTIICFDCAWMTFVYTSDCHIFPGLHFNKAWRCWVDWVHRNGGFAVRYIHINMAFY